MIALFLSFFVIYVLSSAGGYLEKSALEEAYETSPNTTNNATIITEVTSEQALKIAKDYNSGSDKTNAEYDIRYSEVRDEYHESKTYTVTFLLEDGNIETLQIDGKTGEVILMSKVGGV